MDEQGMARTEVTFREVNEAIAQTAERFEAGEADFICECSDPHCSHRITTDLDEYEQVRRDATHFLVAPGHDRPEVERVVGRGPDYRVVEKFGRTVAEIVRRLNPRARPA
jgi:hypothetical protein